MVNTDKLRGVFREKGCSVAQAAAIAGISPATMDRRLRNGVFGTDEIDKLVVGLSIENPEEIFFTQLVTSKVTQ